MPSCTESVVEDAALAWVEALDHAVLHLPAPQRVPSRQAGDPAIWPAGDTLTPILYQREREDYTDVMIDGRLHQGLVGLNPNLPEGSR